MGLLTDRKKDMEGFLQMCQSEVIGSHFLKEQTGQVPCPSFNPQVFRLDLDEDTSFAMGWLANEIRQKGQHFLGWPYILESTDELRGLLDGLFKEMRQYVHDYFNYDAARYIKPISSLAGRIADILLDEICRHIAQSYNYLHMRPPHKCSREDQPAPAMDTSGCISGDYFRNILDVAHDCGVIESPFIGGWPESREEGNVYIHFSITLRPDARLGTMNHINLITMTIKYPVSFYGNLDQQ